MSLIEKEQLIVENLKRNHIFSQINFFKKFISMCGKGYLLKAIKSDHELTNNEIVSNIFLTKQSCNLSYCFGTHMSKGTQYLMQNHFDKSWFCNELQNRMESCETLEPQKFYVSLKKSLFQIIYTLYCLGINGLYHGDLHLNNICYTDINNTFYYQLGHNTFKIDPDGETKFLIIIDYDRSYKCNDEPDNRDINGLLRRIIRRGLGEVMETYTNEEFISFLKLALYDSGEYCKNPYDSRHINEELHTNDTKHTKLIDLLNDKWFDELKTQQQTPTFKPDNSRKLEPFSMNCTKMPGFMVGKEPIIAEINN